MEYNNYLVHHGILGQKWGVRRFQAANGKLTMAGKKRYAKEEYKSAKKAADKSWDKATKKWEKATDGGKKYNAKADKELDIAADKWASDRRNAKQNYKDSKKAAVNEYHQSDAYKDKRSKAIKIGTAVVVGSMAVAALSNKNVRDKLVEAVQSEANREKAKDFIKNKSGQLAKGIGNSATKAGKAMTDAALVSIGTIQISKLAKRLETNEGDSESVKNRNKLILDTATAGISSITKAGSGNQNNSNKSGSGGNLGKEVSSKLGEPSNKGIDKSSQDYQSLFKDGNGNQRDAQTRSTIKSLASAGYDIDQIRTYVDELDRGNIKHSDNDEYSFIAAYYVGKNYISSMM